MCGRTQGASTIQLYINDNAFICTHLGCVPTFLAVILIINKKEEGVSNCNVFDAPSFSFCEVWKFFKPPCFESFPQIFDFSHIKLEQYP